MGGNPTGSPSALTAPCWRSVTTRPPTVDLLDGHSLAPLPGPNVDGLRNGTLAIVTWSKDGRTLYAGGRYWDGSADPVLAWADAGRGARRTLPAGSNTVAGLAALPDGRALRCGARPVPGVTGARRQTSLGARFAQRRLSRSRRPTGGVGRRHHCRFWLRANGASRRFASICARSSSVAIHRPISRRSQPSKPDLPSRDGVMGLPRPSMGSQSS